ncbi:MAG: ABC transporter ATP-binding protein [Pseudobutyrivibrio sp.]|nr:ABC transporter ATP-binding protein [Pseudobutyrivibrio sp.]
MDNIIKISDLVVGYGAPVVSQVNINVAPGEIIAIIGPNGAGKSTILKTITKQLKKLDGKIYIDETDDDSISGEDLAKKLSMVSTEKIHPELMTCWDVVATGRYPYTGRLGILSKEDNEAVDKAIALVGAEDVAAKDFSRISDGQRQRIMLARAICQEPEILILDEPTSFLDIQFKVDILGVIRRLAKEKGIAVIMSIHELEFVPAIADRVIAVDSGSMAYVGTAKEVLTGENISHIYHMPQAEAITDGLWQYANSLKEYLWQK